MSIIQISKIQVRSGNIDDLPQLDVGEFGFAADSNRLFIGTDTGNVVGPSPDNIEILTQFSTSNTSPGGSNTQVQFNNNGVFGGSANLTFNGNSLALTGNLVLSGRYVSNLTSGLTTVAGINCALGNYFKITASTTQTFSAINVPATGSVYSMTLEIQTNAGSSITWPSSVYWPNGAAAPTLSATGKTSLIMMVTIDGGTKWRAASLIDYTT
jgi:hypothetical protein